VSPDPAPEAESVNGDPWHTGALLLADDGGAGTVITGFTLM
jgi:hypothetical protein